MVIKKGLLGVIVLVLFCVSAVAANAKDIIYDDFSSGVLNKNVWEMVDYGRGNNAGESGLPMVVKPGVVIVQGAAKNKYWGGRMLKTVQAFSASPQKPLVVTVENMWFLNTGQGMVEFELWFWQDMENNIMLAHDTTWRNGWFAERTIGGKYEYEKAVKLEDGANDFGQGKEKTITAIYNGDKVEFYKNGQMMGFIQAPLKGEVFVLIGFSTRTLESSVDGGFKKVIISDVKPDFFSK